MSPSLHRIADLIPPAGRHRHHYHGAFAPNSKLRPCVTKAAIETPSKHVPTLLQEAAQKTAKVSFTWAKLIARIYEVNPLICSCGKEIRIIKIVTDPIQIWRILNKIGWPTTTAEFDEPCDLVEWDICQLVPGTKDGFPDDYGNSFKSGTDPPAFSDENIDSPHWEDPFIQYD